MKLLLIASLAFSAPASAGLKDSWLFKFCERHLIIGEDPWPYFDYPTSELVHLHKRFMNENQEAAELVERELRIRLQDRQLNLSERTLIIGVLSPWEGEK